MSQPVSQPPHVPPARPPAWFPDPMDDNLIRYWDGHRWTFHTAFRRNTPPGEIRRPEQAASTPPRPALREDIALAVERVQGLLIGSMKEVNLLAGYLGPEERVLALSPAVGEGAGVLACTNHRLLFLFVGVLRRQFLQVNWNQAKGVVYDQSTKIFAIYTTKPTKRALPAMTVRVNNLTDAQSLAHAAQAASAAPRLDIV